ncbi:energy transducer TonB [Dyadobacter sp. CY343]|uniref:energy transducer TonB n=1 Tax=Dyadobacter sp. CY343 TaxID=2907299 RepID=UPI001F2000AF|nr:energy transducer TonB [Dyadobacter sp. CY343]MCE7059144.1 energy transducer TonB [Dyadobacter sp. CY343]
MKRLHEDRIDLIKSYLKSRKLSPELLPEILDHLACEAEERLWDGKPFEQIYSSIVETADNEVVLNLNADHKNLLAMEKSLNDIVFEGRNKLYGAYDLRKSYGQTIQKSVLMGVALFGMIVFFPNLYARLVPDPKPGDIAYIVEARPIDITRELPKPMPEKPEPAPEAKTLRSLPPVVMQDDEVAMENLPPVLKELENAAPAAKTLEGIEDLEIIVPPAAEFGNAKTAAADVKTREESIFLHVEQAPEYMGGVQAMAAFLQKNLKYPVAAARAGIQGRVFVQFTVGSDGNIEDVTALKGIGFGCDEEAVRVVKMMQNWMPGRQAGNPVRVKFTLPIAFQIN